MVDVPHLGQDDLVQDAAIQVICLASGGGPAEDNVTGFLVRSGATNWARNSLLAVDAGCHLASIINILQEHGFKRVCPEPDWEAIDLKTAKGRSAAIEPSDAYPSMTGTTLTTGPFAGFSFSHLNARANALQLVRDLISTYMITHPHLDHLSGFAINTAAFHNTSRPKCLAGLPSTINAIKQHIFNDVIWPNLTDEEGGVGFVTFQRLAEGGNVALGEGGSRGFMEVVEGLGVKGFKISHGHCMKGPEHVHAHGSGRGSRGSVDGSDHVHWQQPGYSYSPSSHDAILPPQGHQGCGGQSGRRHSTQYPATPLQQPSTPSIHDRAPPTRHPCVVDSTAYFVRDDKTEREILMFGDVEPDSLSLMPRNHIVWAEAAPKVASGILKGIFIECSYADEQPDEVLFGHLAPRHLIKELQTLAEMVEKLGAESRGAAADLAVDDANHVDAEVKGSAKKRKRSSRIAKHSSPEEDHKRSKTTPSRHGASSTSPTKQAPHIRASSSRRDESTASTSSTALPLAGLRVVVIHIKDTMKDGFPVGVKILQQLCDHERGLRDAGKGLGCEFIISRTGKSYWF